MRCFSSGTGRSTTGGIATAGTHPSPSLALAVGTGSGEEEERINGERRRGRSRDRSPFSECSSVPTTSAAASPAAGTINLSREYMHAVTTNSYKEIWSKIHRDQGEEESWEDEDEEEEVVVVVEDSAAPAAEGAPPPLWSARLIARVLRPGRASIQNALRGAPPTHLVRLVSDYFDSSEHTSHFCLSLHEAVDRARSLYAPIRDLADLLPAPDVHPARLTHAQCDWAFDRLLEFDQLDNPFPAPSGDGSCSFQGMRGCFAELKQQLDLRLLKARRRHRLLRCVTQGSGACLIVSTIGLAVTGVVLATHALVALMVGPACSLGGCHPTRDLLGGQRRRLRDYMDQLDAASREAYVLNNDLDTIERLVARLHAIVESDRVLVRLGLESGRGQRHPIEEVVRQLCKNHRSFFRQLDELEEHICLYFAAVNRARSLLLTQIQQQPPPP